MPKQPNFSDDDFEQFDSPRSKQDKSRFEEPYRTRTSRLNHATEPKAITVEELRVKIQTRAITYLSRREYSRAELAKKLTDAFSDYTFDDQYTALIQRILDDLQRGNWQSDQRYAAQISKVKGERFGIARLKHEFKQKGLDDELVQAELSTLKASELERAREVWRKKFNHLPTDLKEKAKQIRFMASRGFSYETVNKIIKNLDDDM